MRIAVTGAAGFLGRHLLAAIASRGDEAVAIDLTPVEAEPGVRPVVADVTDRAAMEAALAGADALIHGAAITGLWAPSETAFDRVNNQGTRTALAAAEAAGLSRAVLVSSFVTMIDGGRSDPPRRVTEADVPPLDAMAGPYPRSKWQAEAAARAAAVPTVIVNPVAPLGPGDHGPTPPGGMIRDLAARKLPAMVSALWCFVDVRDLAEATLAALDMGRPRERYLIGGETLDTDAFLARFEEATGVPGPRVRVPWAVAMLAARAGEATARITRHAPQATVTGVRLIAPRLSFDAAKAREELGFAPRPLERTLTDTLAWLRQTGIAPGVASGAPRP